MVFYDAFHTRHVGPGVKGIIGMHKFNICLVVVVVLSLSCSGVKTPLVWIMTGTVKRIVIHHKFIYEQEQEEIDVIYVWLLIV